MEAILNRQWMKMKKMIQLLRFFRTRLVKIHPAPAVFRISDRLQRNARLHFMIMRNAHGSDHAVSSFLSPLQYIKKSQPGQIGFRVLSLIH
ncbi:hypothetical protein D3C73_1483160 [compost metagenome]